MLHRALNIPSPESTCDFVTAFSLFTHLLHAESYIYLQDIKRVLKPGGKLVFSFLEFLFESHWRVFESTVEQQRHQVAAPLNMFIERSVIDVWSAKLGYRVEGYVSGAEAPWGGKPLGQSVAILRR